MLPTMDSFAAIGLAGNIITFIDFGFEVVSAAREIYSSTTGTTSENKDLEFLTDKVTNLALNLQIRKPTSLMVDNERNLNDLAIECTRLSVDLLDLLKNLKARKAGSTKEALQVVWRNIRKKKEKTELETRLEKCWQQLHLQLTSTARLAVTSFINLDGKFTFGFRSETLERLNQVIDSGELHKNELTSLRQNVEVLRSSLDAKHLSSEDLDQIHSLLNQSDQSLTKVYQNLILDGLRFEKMNDRFDEVKEAHLKTFGWILGKSNDDSGYDRDESDGDYAANTSHNGSRYHDQEDYQLRLRARDKLVNWLENGNGIFHVSGKPGAGKSTLMKYLCKHPRTEKLVKVWSGEKQLVIAKFFFWRPGNEFQKSLKGLLRGLLRCIFDQSPNLIQTTFPKQWESAKYQRSIQFDEYEIQEAFSWIVQQNAIYDKRKFVFFIDGLDEFEGEHAEMIRRLFSWVSARPDDIKICVSSREELIFQERFSKCPKIRLHELTRRDIAIFVQDTLAANEDFRAVEKSAKELATLQKQIIDKSEGVFLWVSLAVRTLEQGLLADDRIQDLEKKIQALPPELDDLFQYIFDSITKRSHPIDCRNAIRILAIVMDLQRQHLMELPLTRYSFLEDFQDDPDFAIKRPVQNMSEEDMRQRLRRSRKQIYARCKGFLEVVSVSNEYGIAFRKEVLKFIHRCLAEYLQKKETQEKIAPHLVDFDIFDFHCQSFVAELKSLEPDDHYFTRDHSQFGLDIEQCVKQFSNSEPDNSARFYSFLDQLAGVVTARLPAERKGSISTYLPTSWSYNTRSMNPVTITDCHPSTYIRFYAIEYGLYEYLLRDEAESLMEPHYRHRERNESLVFALQTISYPLWFNASQDRQAKILGYCFENGISANSHGGFSRTASCWQRVIWTLMTTSPSWKALEFEPMIRVFLLYGAEPYLWLRFGPRYKSNKGEKLVRVGLQVGAEREEPFNAIYIDPNSECIVGFAKEKGWTLSLRDIVEYWFPKRAKVLQELIDRNATRQVDPEEGEVEKLKAMSHLDLNVWKGLSYERDKCLFSYFKVEDNLKREGFALENSY
jgi:hypothetical protein